MLKKYLTKKMGRVMVAAAMAAALVVPAGVQAAAYKGDTGCLVAAPGTTVQKNLRCYYGSASYNLGMVKVLSNGTTGYTRISQQADGVCTLYVGSNSKLANSCIFFSKGAHEISCACKNQSAYGQATGSVDR